MLLAGVSLLPVIDSLAKLVSSAICRQERSQADLAGSGQLALPPPSRAFVI
jgi:hypothetical protein